MKPNIPIALGAGAIAAIVFVSATTGPVIARMLLLAIVTLPVALAGFAYGAVTALAAAAVATLTISALVSLPFGALFALTTVLPSVGLIYLALLHREPSPGQAEWFPVGRVVVAASLMAASVVASGFALAAGQEGSIEKLRAAVTEAVKQAIKAGFAGMPGSTGMTDTAVAQLSEVMLNLMPGLSSALWMGSILSCLWLAAHVALASGQLQRPWPPISLMTFPPGTALLLALALAGVLFLDGLPRLIALGFAGALYFAYVLLGLAIVHHLTRPLSWRNPALTGIYALLIIATSPASLILAFVGLLDTLRPLRGDQPQQPAP
jgi:hypothetical protein